MRSERRIRVRTRKPIVILIRRVFGDKSVWLEHSGHQTDAEAERTWAATIKGRGVTAWSCWVPRDKAAEMLNDSTIVPED